MKQLLSGNEALALGAWHAGVAVAAAYPGTPSTEILQELAKMDGIYVEWSTNEKVALEVAMGASYAGVRALASMKHVGLNVAADPFFAVSTTGIIGGLVVVSADDPGEHSSQGEQDNRHFARFAKVPMLEPADSQDAYDVMGWAYAISEEFDTPVLVRPTTRISHCKTVVEVDPERKAVPAQPQFRRAPAKYVMVPSNARVRRLAMEERIVKLHDYVETFPMNKMLLADRKLGVISSGVAYQYAREVFKDASFLKLVTTYPFPSELIRRFAREVDQVIVIEELDPYLEDEVRRLGIPVRGKEFIPLIGELTVEIAENGAVQAGLLPGKRPASAPATEAPLPLPLRRPQLCAGCPHVGTEYVLRKLGLRTNEGPVQKGDFVVTSDIGCYTLGVYPPLAALDTCACMGASIGHAIGLKKAGIPNKVVAVLGDSTFMHSGITGLVDAVYNQASITVIILDNETTAMTGHQGHPGTGISARGLKTQAVKLEDVVRGVGVRDVNIVSAFDLAEIESAIRKCTENDEPSVIIARGPCTLAVKTRRTPFAVDTEECTSCYVCLDTGCPAISLVDDRAHIDESCAGCGVCAQVCPQEAILEDKR
ncbi:MAG: indolepyruvate ferredoxin oxidoreductase subunit alpha [Dehalococcoidia bacterium]|nr:indolepyruvate ferredoxin oxidoreductase subunit alpha [Dehalococcoidia bacterium]